MKRFIAVLVLVLAVAAAMPVLAEDRVDSKIRFSDLYGEVSIRPDAEEDDAYETAEFNTIIYDNDRIKTEEESGAILSLEDMSTYVIKPESILIVRAENKNVNKLEMLAGCIVGNVKKMAEGKVMGVEMSQCVAGIKGTTFRLRQSKDRKVNTVDVTSGVIEITSKKNHSVYQVPAGQSFTIRDDGRVASKTIVIEDVNKELFKEYNEMEEKSGDEELIKKLNNKSSGIKDTLKNFNDRFNSCYNKRNNTEITALESEFALLKLDATRYKGEIDEANITLNVAAGRKINNRGLARSKDKAVSDLRAQCANYDKLMKRIYSFTEEIEKIKASSSAATKDEIEVAMNTISSLKTNIDSVVVDAEEVIDNTKSGSSYSDFKEAKEKCRQYLDELANISSDINGVPVNNETAKALSSLNSKHDSTTKYIKKALKDFESVPEITNDLIKNMNDIDQVIPDYASKVREYLAEYKSIEDSSVDKEKRYVTAVSKLLVSYDRTKRQYTKASRMQQQVVKDFKKSAFETSEYTEIIESWDRIESAMTELDTESAELSFCVEQLKNRLEELLGQ